MNLLISRIFVALFILAACQALYAQDELDYEVILPAAAQDCVLPSSPDTIPADATKEQLLEAKAAVAAFQTEVEAYRACLSAAEEGDITPGNEQAIVASYNYSVEMEERVATRFNEAVRAYREREADG